MSERPGETFLRNLEKPLPGGRPTWLSSGQQKNISENGFQKFHWVRLVDLYSLTKYLPEYSLTKYLPDKRRSSGRPIAQGIRPFLFHQTLINFCGGSYFFGYADRSRDLAYLPAAARGDVVDGG